MTARMKDCPTCGGLGAVPEDGVSLGDALAADRAEERTRPGWAVHAEQERQAAEQRQRQAERLRVVAP
jgi:hypothetical protein